MAISPRRQRTWEFSPSTLTQAIRALEERLGVRLFNRTTRSVSLTTAGVQLLRHMQPVMGAIDDALDAMNNFRDNPRGILRLSVVRAAAVSIIAPLVPAFLRELWAVAGLALAAIGTAWLTYSYRQSDAAAPTIGAAEAASLREILLGIPADGELVRPIPSRPAS